MACSRPYEMAKISCHRIAVIRTPVHKMYLILSLGSKLYVIVETLGLIEIPSYFHVYPLFSCNR